MDILFNAAKLIGLKEHFQNEMTRLQYPPKQIDILEDFGILRLIGNNGAYELKQGSNYYAFSVKLLAKALELENE